jgi:hypothetical protein
MIGVTESGRKAINRLGNVFILPPGKRVDTESLKYTKDGEKGSHTNDQIDKVSELGPGAYCMDNEIVDG